MKTYKLENSMVKLNGEYWIGDPCYVFSDEDWQKLVKLMFPTHNTPDFNDSNNIRVVDVDGHLCYLFGTAYGDGSYELLSHTAAEIDILGVDAGMLSMIPVTLLKEKGWEIDDCGVVKSFKNANARMTVENGNFRYERFSICTDGSDIEDDDEDYY